MTPRQLWQLFEPVHAVSYFLPPGDEPLRRAGVAGFWAPYVLQRAAPLGPVGPAVVTAAFFGFHPRRAAAVLPSGWAAVPPAEALAARSEGAVAALRAYQHLTDVPALADLLWTVAQHAACAGRVLAAANQALPRPAEPLAALWQAATTLREHRGDGHVAVLVSEGVGPVEAMQLKVAAGESPAEGLRLGRAWGDRAWEQTGQRLRDRGLVAAGGELTAAGSALHLRIEQRTDEAAAQPWSVLTPPGPARVAALLEPLAAAVWRAGALPALNPIGVQQLPA